MKKKTEKETLEENTEIQELAPGIYNFYTGPVFK